MASFPDQLNMGLFVPTTNIWDISDINDIDVKSPEFKELIVRLYQNINNIALALNLKDSGYYTLTEFLNGQVYFPDPTLTSTTTRTPVFRQVFRKVINFGALPAAGTKSVAHAITMMNQFSATRIYGASTDQTGLSWIPLPYASPVLADNIELNIDATNVNVTVGSNRSNYTVSYIVIEFLKQ